MCCSGFLKIMMFVFNGGIFLAGAAILTVGIWAKVDSGSLMGLLDSVEILPEELGHIANVGYLLIVVGAVLVIIGFLGCCGAVRESKCMLLTFFIIVLIIFISEVAAAVLLLVFEPLIQEILGEVEGTMIDSITAKFGSEEAFTELWLSAMDQFKCCGYTNYTNFDDSKYIQTFKYYPETCCNSTIISSNRDCTKDLAELSDIDGCFQKLLLLIEDNVIIIGAVILGIAALEIAAMVVSMILYRKSKK